MKVASVMEKIIGASEITRNFGKFLREVEVKGDKIVWDVTVSR